MALRHQTPVEPLNPSRIGMHVVKRSVQLSARVVTKWLWLGAAEGQKAISGASGGIGNPFSPPYPLGTRQYTIGPCPCIRKA